MSLLSILDREHSVARPGYSRWLVPPAALAVHLSIGQVYSFSVFKIPLTRLLGIAKSTPGDWTQAQIGWIFSLAIGILGLSAALFGPWLEREGPRKAMAYAAVLFALGFFVSSVGVRTHQLWLLYLGYGVIGGIGLGLGYIAPVATLIKWFPDRPGLATGMAIMGFGGGAMIGSPMAVKLMAFFHTPADLGVSRTMIVMGCFYFFFMLFGALLVRLPRPEWKPEGWTAPTKSSGMVSTHNVAVGPAFRTPQFWLLWLVLCMNTTAGIGIVEQASPMIQDLFGISAVAAGGFVGVLSLFNMGGRFFWSTISDYLGRKVTFMILLLLGVIGYAVLPYTGHAHLNSIVLFVLISGVLLSMYGAGFSTIPAYLKDMFGSQQIGAIYGRLLTAWSVAGIVGPVLVNYTRESQLAHGVDRATAYQTVLHIMAGLLVVGFLANLLVRPVAEKYWINNQPLGKG
ncbi:L-lactate MFS transporter [Acidipila rosea]|uniref:Nitrate/nitrite transporter NarK n=1 Tax=Acidipila rosea TaxID=768535 RepID=A0A4R1LEN0_9BACT|nr:OFA family MFS transporter [Acidipila rosea]TCK75293.1 nitrate/nitrite transporter NarK [Acidipila rosea]